jgi:hypothetical protein
VFKRLGKCDIIDDSNWPIVIASIKQSIDDDDQPVDLNVPNSRGLVEHEVGGETDTTTKRNTQDKVQLLKRIWAGEFARLKRIKNEYRPLYDATHDATTLAH